MSSKSWQDKLALSYLTALGIGLLVFIIFMGIRVSWTMISEYEGNGVVVYDECIETETVEVGYEGETRKLCVDKNTVREGLENRIEDHIISSSAFAIIASLISVYFIRQNKKAFKEYQRHAAYSGQTD